MPEVNTDKIFAAFLLRLEEVAQIEDFDDIEKEFLGKIPYCQKKENHYLH